MLSDTLSDVRRTRLPLPESGLEIALLDWGGEGPLAFLQHANGFCSGLWAPVAEGLRERFRVVAMDARGHGDSDKPEGAASYHWAHFGRDVAAVAGHLAERHGPVALGLGHSFGGTALVLAAIERPDLFERLVLLDPIVMPSRERESDAVRRAGARGLAAGARARRQVWESRTQARTKWAGKDAFAEWEPRALDLYVAEALGDRPDGRVQLKCPGEVEAMIFEANGSVDVMERAARLETPALILWARRGNFSRAHFEELASRMQRGRVRDADTGHFIPMENAGLVVDEVFGFSARSEGSDPSSRSSLPAARRPG
jgi:pimeloyl-ACP methyl ester carboxylesterase